MYTIVVLAVGVAMLITTHLAVPQSTDQVNRHDLADLQRLLRLIAALYPEMDGRARVTSTVGSLDGKMISPLISVSLVEHSRDLMRGPDGQLVEEPTRDVYSGGARFDTRGKLLSYRGSTPDGDERFRRLMAQCEREKVDDVGLVSLLKGLGAAFAVEPPSTGTSRGLRTIVEAVGTPLEMTVSPKHLSLGGVAPGKLVRSQLVWTVGTVVERDGVRRQFGISIDPWGEVLVVGRYGEAWP
jgi:hypothetical protein